MHCLISHFNTVSVTRMYLSNGNHVCVLRFIVLLVLRFAYTFSCSTIEIRGQVLFHLYPNLFGWGPVCLRIESIRAMTILGRCMCKTKQINWFSFLENGNNPLNIPGREGNQTISVPYIDWSLWISFNLVKPLDGIPSSFEYVIRL